MRPWGFRPRGAAWWGGAGGGPRSGGGSRPAPPPPRAPGARVAAVADHPKREARWWWVPFPLARQGGAAGEVVTKVKAGYAFGGPALELGALVTDDASHPDVGVRIPLAMLNRHGLVAGATGTGKTKTLQLMAEQLSAAGVPVFVADIKGDLSGLASPGVSNDRVAQRATDVGEAWAPASFPTEFYSLGGQGAGAPIRVTVTSFGADAAVEGARPQRDAGVVARPGLPLRRQGRPAAARPQGPARGHPVPRERRGQVASSTGSAGSPRRPLA